MTMSNNIGQFGDTSLTKVFVGGLAWETQTETMREHFEKYGEILEAVIISDKVTGRSKGYGFVTFKEAEAAKKACEEATPVINGRRANCNLASLGARRPRSASTTTTTTAAAAVSQQGGCNIGPRSTSAAPASHVQWYYPTGTPASPFHPHHGVPFHPYGYSPTTYVAAEMGYNPKVGGGYSGGGGGGGSYMNGHFSHVYAGQGMMSANTIMPVYPVYQFHHQSQTMGLPAHIYPQTTAAAHVTTVPTIISKPPSMTPNAGTGTQLKGGLEREAKST